MKITWALIVQRRIEHDRARELDDALFRPVANRMRDFIETYLDAPLGTVTMHVSATGGSYGAIDLSFMGEQAVVAVTVRHAGEGVIEAMVDSDGWFDVTSASTPGMEAIAERVARMLLRPEVAR